MAGMRIGLVRYLNARPLDYGLRSAADLHASGSTAGDAPEILRSFFSGAGSAGLTLIEETPSQLFQMLRAGQLDAALISSVECLRNPDLFGYCPTVGVCARSEVYSIVYIRRRTTGPVHFESPVRRILADSGSRSSIALLEALYFQANGVLPEIQSEEPDRIVERLGPDEGGLLIGDGALRFLDQMRDHPDSTIEHLDLAGWWHRSEQLPFVFALWAYPKSRPVPDAVFEASLTAGENNITAIIAAAGRSDARRYLTENLHYRLGLSECAALQRFHERLAAAGLLGPDAA